MQDQTSVLYSCSINRYFVYFPLSLYSRVDREFMATEITLKRMKKKNPLGALAALEALSLGDRIGQNMHYIQFSQIFSEEGQGTKVF